jgi:hypothetical protein
MSAATRKSVGAKAEIARLSFLNAVEGENSLKAQDSMVAECVTMNADTGFGRDHGFASVRNIDDYRRAVPIRHYEELEPWVARAAEGEECVLTKSPLIRFWKTTGTTSASKKIPVTSASAMRNVESFLTLYGAQLHYHPEIGSRPDSSLVTHVSPKRVKEYLGPKKIPYCSTTEAPVQVRASHHESVAPWVIGLQDVVEDDSVRLYYLLCYAALHDLRNITCLHPSRFQTLLATLHANWPRMLDELRRGTVLDNEIREPAPERADALARIARRTDTLTPADIWPNLTFLSSWSGTYISRYRDVMERAFCRGFMPMPSISSEAFATMTIDPDPVGQPLNIRGAIFEFVPVDQKIEPTTPTLQFHELEEGESYEMILTTLGGLYRYAMCDIFKVIGFVGRVPRLEYSGRRSVCDLVGEKLAEEQVAVVVERNLAKNGLVAASFAMCGLQSQNANDKPRYVLVFESPEDLPAQVIDDFTAQLDGDFRSINPRYELKRNFGDLLGVVVQRVEAGTFVRYRESLVRRGMPAGQLKDKVLHADGHSVLSDLLGIQ